MTAKLTTEHKIDGLKVYFTNYALDTGNAMQRADVIVVDALTMEHATSIASQLLTEKGFDGYIARRRYWTKHETGETVYQIDFDLEDTSYLDPEMSEPVSTIW